MTETRRASKVLGANWAFCVADERVCSEKGDELSLSPPNPCSCWLTNHHLPRTRQFGVSSSSRRQTFVESGDKSRSSGDAVRRGHPTATERGSAAMASINTSRYIDTLDRFVSGGTPSDGSWSIYLDPIWWRSWPELGMEASGKFEPWRSPLVTPSSTAAASLIPRRTSSGSRPPFCGKGCYGSIPPGKFSPSTPLPSSRSARTQEVEISEIKQIQCQRCRALGLSPWRHAWRRGLRL